MRSSRTVVLGRTAAVATAQHEKPSLRGDDVGHLPALTRAHRAQPPRRDARARVRPDLRESIGGDQQPRSSTIMKPTRIGVIGGGLAGIAAALTLADAGVDVTLLERRPRLGGLTSSIERDGLSFDNGQHVFLGCCSAYQAFIERLGAIEQVFKQPRLNVPVLTPSGTLGSITRSGLPAPLHLVSSLARYRYLSIKDRILLVRAVFALRRLDLSEPSLDTLTFGDWLRQHGQSQRAIDRLWNLIIQPMLNVTADQ